MRQTLFIALILIIFSCKNKDECLPEFKESLEFLKEYIEPENEKVYYGIEITDHIEVLESISGILNGDQGGTLGKTFVFQRDVDKWEKWLTEKCPKNNKIE